MKQTKLTHLASCTVAVVVTLAAASANGQDFGDPIFEGEVLPNQAFSDQAFPERVLPDQVLEYQGLADSVAVPPSEDCNYVGDIPIEDSGAAGGGADYAEGGSSGDFGGMFQGRSYGRPDLFYNFYTQGYANQANAQMYLSPLPIPPNVGHTFYTYQPFYPHHMMYWHKDRFHRSYDNGRGMNRTRAVYYSPPIRQALCNIYWNCLRLPR